MVEHEVIVGQLLDELKKFGVEENTIVMYTSDNGAEFFMWPDGGTTIFRGEKNTQWEGGYRVPCFIRWPGIIKPGTIINDMAHTKTWFQHCSLPLANPPQGRFAEGKDDR